MHSRRAALPSIPPHEGVQRIADRLSAPYADGADTGDIRRKHQLRSVRTAALLRIAVVGLLVGAMLLGTRAEEWFAQSILLACYAAGAIWATVLAFSTAGTSAANPKTQTVIAVGDVAAISIFELLSSRGYVPLAVMAALPLLVALEVSVRRAAIILGVSAVAFTAVMVLDPEMTADLGWLQTVFLCGLFAFLCCTALGRCFHSAAACRRDRTAGRFASSAACRHDDGLRQRAATDLGVPA